MNIDITIPETRRPVDLPSMSAADEIVPPWWPPCDHGSSSRGSSVRPASTWRDWREATDLLFDFMTWIRAASGHDLFEVQPALRAELDDLRGAYADPGSAFFVADDGVAVCGTLAVRRHADGAAELKRMYVRPSARGGGHAGRLVETAVDHARSTGVRTLWLESLRGVMDPAIALYERHGFVESTGVAPTVQVDGLIRMEQRFDD